MLDTASLIDFLAQPQKIVITTHHKPDGDAMGSSLGLYNYLIQQGHHAQVITPTDYPQFLNWMPGNGDVIIYTDNVAKSDQLIADADMIFCLDFNALGRINEMGEKVGESNALKIMIDHHLEPQDFDDYRHWDINACATAQLVYTFIVEILGHKELVNADVASCLYTGIMTDSGSFRLPNTTSTVHRIVADLIDAGAPNARIHELVYNDSTEMRLRFLGHCLANKLQVFNEFNTALITVNAEELKEYDVITGDTEGIVNYALSISNVRLAAFMVERKDKVKLSLRSKAIFRQMKFVKSTLAAAGIVTRPEEYHQAVCKRL